MRVERARFVKGLKIVDWLLKQPQFTVTDKNFYLHGRDGRCYLGAVVQDLHFEMPLTETVDTFLVSLPVQATLNIVTVMDPEIQIRLHDTHVTLSDTIQLANVTMSINTSIPNILNTEESTRWACIPLLTHLQEVALEQESEVDLSISFTGRYASIGNYMSAKRVPFATDTQLVIPHAIARLINACAKVETVQEMDVTLTNQQLICNIGTIYVATSVYSTLVRDADSVFEQLQPTYRATYNLKELQSTIVRIQRMTKEESLQLEIGEDGSCYCRVQDEVHGTEIKVQPSEFTGLGNKLTVEVDRATMYHLLRKVLGEGNVELQVDTNQEILYFRTEEEEMVISISIV